MSLVEYVPEPSVVLLFCLVSGMFIPRLGFMLTIVWLFAFTNADKLDAALSALSSAGAQQ